MVMVRPLVSKFLGTVSTLQSRPCRDWEITRPLAAGQPPATGRDIALLRCLRWRSPALGTNRSRTLAWYAVFGPDFGTPDSLFNISIDKTRNRFIVKQKQRN